MKSYFVSFSHRIINFVPLQAEVATNFRVCIFPNFVILIDMAFGTCSLLSVLAALLMSFFTSNSVNHHILHFSHFFSLPPKTKLYRCVGMAIRPTVDITIYAMTKLHCLFFNLHALQENY